MKIDYSVSTIKVLNNKSEILCELPNTAESIQFIEKWHFLKTYSETNKYNDAFNIVYSATLT